ncbi:MAG: G5 domain-containing protein [Oscillospiraceae bacterium]|nr:G5 domain-containing protein [Oscillospiraceae bacterium]
MSTQEKSKEELIREMHQRREKRRLTESRRRMASIIAVVTIIVIITGAVFTASAKEISITEIDEFNGTNETKTVYTLTGGKVGDILDKHDLNVHECDKINVPIDKEITGDEEIVIKRGKEITIVADGVESGAIVTKADAHDALVEAGYIPSETDEISVNNGGDLTSGDRIEFVTVSNTEDVVNEAIEQETEYVDDPDLPVGETRVIDEGCSGVREIRSSVIYRSGEEFYREILSDTVTEEPQKTIIAVGTKTPEPTVAPVAAVTRLSSASTVSDTGGTINGMSYSRKINMTATAYSTSPSENGGYTTSAMGNSLRYGIVAIDPSIVPLGSRVYVASADGSWTYGVASAEDTGGAIKGNRIDLCYESIGEANRFGRRGCVVYILD